MLFHFRQTIVFSLFFAVTNTTGGLSIAARNAQDVVSNCRLPVGGASHMTLYVAGQQASFAVQQCMLICEAYYIATKQHHHNQVGKF